MHSLNLLFDSDLNTDNNTDMEPIEKEGPRCYINLKYISREKEGASRKKKFETQYTGSVNPQTGSLTTDINSRVIFASNENHHPDCEPMSVIFFITIFNTNPPHSNILIKYT